MPGVLVASILQTLCGEPHQLAQILRAGQPSHEVQITGTKNALWEAFLDTSPLPHLLYAQVIKTVRRRRLVRVRHRVVFGTLAAVQQVLAACGWQINTAFVERLN